MFFSKGEGVKFENVHHCLHCFNIFDTQNHIVHTCTNKIPFKNSKNLPNDPKCYRGITGTTHIFYLALAYICYTCFCISTHPYHKVNFVMI